jgi:hypothetical protein
MDETSPNAKLATHLLQEDLGDWVTRHRKDDRSWRWIADKLGEVTDGLVSLTPERLRQMYADRVSAA